MTLTHPDLLILQVPTENAEEWLSRLRGFLEFGPMLFKGGEPDEVGGQIAGSARLWPAAQLRDKLAETLWKCDYPEGHKFEEGMTVPNDRYFKAADAALALLRDGG